MLTLEDRLRDWQQELLDLTNRNRLLSFSHSTSRPSTLRLVEPDLLPIFEALAEGKRLAIIGASSSDDEADDEDEAELSGPDERLVSETSNAAQLLTGPPIQQPQFATDRTGSLHVIEQATLAGKPPPHASPVSAESAATTLNAVSLDVGQVDVSDQSRLPADRRPPPLPTDSVRTTFSRDKTNRVAHRLHDRARASELEQGINTLYAVFGRLKWQERPGDTWRYAPLILVPVRIDERIRDSSYRLTAADEDPEFNQTLTERLRRDFGISLDIELTEEIPLADVFADVRSAIAPQVGWEVIEDVHIGIVQFHKIRMFRDLTEHAAIALQHPIVQALGVGDVTISAPEGSMLEEDELDQLVTPDQSYAFLDADASQLRAVQLATRGSHLIIHGPPGTGKSQTIANVIAEFLANGKTVLFVSEKAAAIEVVQRRLAEHGLGELCLMLHSHKANKRDIISHLGQRLESDPDQPATPREELAHRRLASTRQSLNRYAEALHQPRGEMQVSAYWGFGELAQLNEAPRLTSPPPGSVANLTHAQLDDWDQLLRQAGRYETVLRAGDAHPWAGLRPGTLSLAEREALRQILTQVSAATDALRQSSDRMANQLNLPRPTSLPEAHQLQTLVASIPRDGELLRIWFNPAHRATARGLAQEAASHATAAADALSRLSPAFDDAILNIATPEAIEAYQRGKLSQLISKPFRSVRAQVRTASRDGLQRPVESELAALRDAVAASQHRQWFHDQQVSLIHELDVAVTALNPLQPEIWTRIVRHLDAVDAIVSQVPPGSVPQELLDIICHPGAGDRLSPERDHLAANLEQIDALLDQLRPFYSSEPMLAEGSRLTTASFDDLARWAQVRRDHDSSLGDWLQARIALSVAHQHGLEDTIAELLTRSIPASVWSAAFKRRVLTHWLDRIVADSDDLREFSGVEHDVLIRQFRELDRDCLTWAPVRIRRSQAQSHGDLATLQGGEIAALRREVQKRRRHLPLRQLFARIPNLLLRLKPCLMMSPLSVAQFLPANLYHFDVVIFDEASQVRPFDAIGAIIRGSQLIVAGDNKQLPPTTFFDRVNDVAADDDDEDLRALESILDALMAKNMPSTRLKWHYRSRHEDLIAFSNHHIYDRQLVTFPPPTAYRSPLQGVHHVYVDDGSYDGPPSGKVNSNEASRVVQLVMQHAQQRSEQSLGVVALNMNQAEEIERQLIAARQRHPLLEEFFREDAQDPFFIKPLELVQGDERDVIIISIGFGKKDPQDPRETLSHHFGPINRDGGERRLNVLVTRARHQILLVSSIRAGDIDPRRTQKLGPLLLKSYLDFADRGPIALEAQTRGGDGDYESPFEEAVGSALERVGFRVDRQIGVSRYRIDLAIVDPEQPGRYLLGIECDGRTYHHSKTARDRDRLRQENLEGLGWDIHRIWSTDWIRQPEVELNRVIARVQEIRNRSAVQPEPLVTTSRHDRFELENNLTGFDESNDVEPIPALDEAPIAAASPIESVSLIQPYILAELTVATDSDLATTPMAELVAAVELCVAIEGPVHWDLVGRRVAAAWGRQRIKGSIETLLYNVLETAVKRGRIRRRGEFLWPESEVEPTPRGLLPDGTPRRIEHISDEELTAGMLLVVGQALSLTANELVMETRRFFGYRRTGKDINERLQYIAAVAVDSGQLVRQGDRYRLPR